MLIKFLKKKIIKSIVDDVIKNIPQYKEQALLIWEGHKDEIFDKVKKAVEDFIVSKIKEVLGKKC